MLFLFLEMPEFFSRHSTHVNLKKALRVPGLLQFQHFVRLRIEDFDFGICERSSFKIRDGERSSSNLLKSFCRTFEKDVFSSGRHLWVQYRSRAPAGGDNFYAVFEAVKQCKDDIFIPTCIA